MLKNVKISMLWKLLEDKICFQTSSCLPEHFAKNSGRTENLQILKKVCFFQSEEKLLEDAKKAPPHNRSQYLA